MFLRQCLLLLRRAVELPGNSSGRIENTAMFPLAVVGPEPCQRSEGSVIPQKLRPPLAKKNILTNGAITGRPLIVL